MGHLPPLRFFPVPLAAGQLVRHVCSNSMVVMGNETTSPAFSLLLTAIFPNIPGMLSPIPKIQSENQDEERKGSSSSEIDHVVDQNSDEQKQRQHNNQIEKIVSDSSSDTDDEVFMPTNPVPEAAEVAPKSDEDDDEDSPEPSQLRNRRVSYGKLPIPPMKVTVQDIQDAAKLSREEPNGEEVGVRKPVDPRRSSVSLDVFKEFRDPHDKKKMPEKKATVYVEGPEGKFREMKKGKFWRQAPVEEPVVEQVEDEEEEEIIPFLLKAAGQAYRTQRIYNTIANIVQGFLAGVSVMLTVFSFNLDAQVLLDGYRYMSLPIQASFLVAFSIGFVSALDRTGIYEVEHFTSKERLKATIYNNGLFTSIVWFFGIIATTLCMQLESQLAFAPTEVPADYVVYNWRVFNIFRSLSAGLGFLLLAYKPDSDTMSKELKQAIFDHIDEITDDDEYKEMILTAMKLSQTS